MKVTISGSLRRHHGDLMRCSGAFRRAGAIVLSPSEGPVVGHDGDFVLLEGDIGSPEHIEHHHLAAIASSDLLYVVAPDGLVGTSTGFEMGVAVGLGVPIFADYLPQDRVFRDIISVASPEQSLLLVQSHETPDLGNDLSKSQRSVVAMLSKMGFQEESTTDLILLALEEFGELAGLQRQRIGLAMHAPREGDLGQELADILIYLMSIASKEGIDLGTALSKKMLVNQARTWHRASEEKSGAILDSQN